MSLSSYELFNIWFPALVAAFVIGLLVTALWDLVRRKFWLFISRFRPGVLNEVGLVSRHQSRAEAEDRHREIIEKMNIFARVLNLLASPRIPNFGATTASDIEAQTEINPHQATSASIHTSAAHGTYTISGSFENPFLPGEIIQGMDCRPINIVITSWFPDGTPEVVTRLAERLYQTHANGPVKRMKSSIILQASIAMDPWVLAEIVELAKQCMRKEKKCIFQLGNWAVLYYNVGGVQLHLLEEGNVPVNIEARWEDGKKGIMMHGLYLMGSQIKVATKSTSKILQSVGPPTEGLGDLDKLHLPNTGFHTLIKEDSLIYAFKFLVVDGVSLILRSEASCILPPEKNSPTILPPEKNPPTGLTPIKFARQSQRVSEKGMSAMEMLKAQNAKILGALQDSKQEPIAHPSPMRARCRISFIVGLLLWFSWLLGYSSIDAPDFPVVQMCHLMPGDKNPAFLSCILNDDRSSAECTEWSKSKFPPRNSVSCLCTNTSFPWKNFVKFYALHEDSKAWNMGFTMESSPGENPEITVPDDTVRLRNDNIVKDNGTLSAEEFCNLSYLWPVSVNSTRSLGVVEHREEKVTAIDILLRNCVWMATSMFPSLNPNDEDRTTSTQLLNTRRLLNREELNTLMAKLARESVLSRRLALDMAASVNTGNGDLRRFYNPLAHLLTGLLDRDEMDLRQSYIYGAYDLSLTLNSSLTYDPYAMVWYLRDDLGPIFLHSHIDWEAYRETCSPKYCEVLRLLPEASKINRAFGTLGMMLMMMTLAVVTIMLRANYRFLRADRMPPRYFYSPSLDNHWGPLIAPSQRRLTKFPS